MAAGRRKTRRAVSATDGRPVRAPGVKATTVYTCARARARVHTTGNNGNNKGDASTTRSRATLRV